MKIYFQNIGISPLKRKIQKIFVCALETVGMDFKNFSVTLKFVKPEEIRTLNKDFRNIDKITDVLSFPNLEFVKGRLSSAKKLTGEFDPKDGLVPLGDIAICKAVAKVQAKEYGHSYKREVCFLALHGFLHLLGFDHIEKADEKEMLKLANKILTKEKVERNV